MLETPSSLPVGVSLDFFSFSSLFLRTQRWVFPVNPTPGSHQRGFGGNSTGEGAPTIGGLFLLFSVEKISAFVPILFIFLFANIPFAFSNLVEDYW